MVPASASANNAFTVTFEDMFGNPVTSAGAITVNLSSNSTGTNEFAATSGGTVATSVQLLANHSTVTAYYGDTKAGTPTITAAATGLTSGSQQETITGGSPHTIAASSGASQSATVATSFTNPLLALVTDTYGNPVSGATVTFTAPAATGASGTFLATTNGGTCLTTGGTAVASCTSTTSATGLASSLTLTADTHAGTYNVAATSTGTTPNPVNFAETNTAALTNDNMSITAGNSQSVTVGAALPTALGINIVDTYGNPVPGMVVTFTAPASGASGTFAACSGGNNASFTTCLVPTNAAGTATASAFTTNHTAGAIAVATSSAGDTTPPTFAETSKAGTATTIAASSGASQSATVATSFTNPLLALVTDTYGNPVSGATVTFTAPAATGASGTLLATTNGGTCLTTGGTAVASCTSYDQRHRPGQLAHLQGRHPRRDLQRGGDLDRHDPEPGQLRRDQHRGTTNDNMTITAGNGQSAMVGAAFPTALGINIVDTLATPSRAWS